MNDLAKNIILWIVIAVVLMSVFQNFGPVNERAQPVPYSQFLDYVDQGTVKSVVLVVVTKAGKVCGAMLVLPTQSATSQLSTVDPPFWL